ncbi:MAG: ligand-binding sensor domain-containing protein, partial [Nitrososphaera sp.]
MIFSSPLFALDPKKRITQYDIRVYKAKDGLPMNDMKDVFQDSKGYLWLACQEGFVRFDGARFVLFDKSNCPGLRENFIYDIEEDWQGNLWLATNGGGVSRFDGKSCTTFDTSNGLASNVVKRILLGRDHTIWFGTENGVTRLKNGVFSSYKFSNTLGPQEIYALYEDRWGDLLVGSAQAGLHVIRNDSTLTLPTEEHIIFFSERVTGEIILGSASGKLFVYYRNS